MSQDDESLKLQMAIQGLKVAWMSLMSSNTLGIQSTNLRMVSWHLNTACVLEVKKDTPLSFSDNMTIDA